MKIIDNMICKVCEFVWIKILAPMIMDKYTRELKDNFMVKGESINKLNKYTELTAEIDLEHLVKYVNDRDSDLVSDLLFDINRIFKQYTERNASIDEMEQILFNVSKSDKMFDGIEIPYVYRKRAYREINTLIIKTIY